MKFRVRVTTYRTGKPPAGDEIIVEAPNEGDAAFAAQLQALEKYPGGTPVVRTGVRAADAPWEVQFGAPAADVKNETGAAEDTGAVQRRWKVTGVFVGACPDRDAQGRAIMPHLVVTAPNEDTAANLAYAEMRKVSNGMPVQIRSILPAEDEPKPGPAGRPRKAA